MWLCVVEDVSVDLAKTSSAHYIMAKVVGKRMISFVVRLHVSWKESWLM